jgi:hypothetical protein
MRQLSEGAVATVNQSINPPAAEDTVHKFRPASPPPPILAKPTFARELLDSTTKFLLPASRQKSVDQPLHGTTKSYAQILEDMLGPDDTTPTPPDNDTKNPNFLLDPTVSKPEPTEEEPTPVPIHPKIHQ